MTTFFVAGIILNVVLTAAALYWLWRQRMPRQGGEQKKKAGAPERNRRSPL